jgi:uncharacterized protein (DUF1810 family)
MHPRRFWTPGKMSPPFSPYPDNLEIHSCMTLFDVASEKREPFSEILQWLFQGHTDFETLRLLGPEASARFV